MESINLTNTWTSSYWNPKNSKKSNRFEIYKKADVLFADMMTNTQGIYKIKKVLKGSETQKKVELFFGDLLESNKDRFIESEMNQKVIDSLINKNNLYFLDYPEIREIYKNGNYYRMMSTISGKNCDAYLEIPFAIFAKVNNYTCEGETDFICLGSVFNNTFYKT